MIIVEGPDDSGKTTLSKRIEEFVWDKYDVCTWEHSVGPKPYLYDFLMEALKMPSENLAVHIADRFYLSELVYQPIFRPDKLLLDFQQHRVVRSMLYTTAPLVIRCHFQMDPETFENREQRFPYDKMMEVEQSYCALDISRLIGAWRVVEYAVEMGYDEVFEAVDAYVKFVREKWTLRRSLLWYGRGNLVRPEEVDTVIVGLQFAQNNKWKVPFERSQSGRLLTSALDHWRIPVERVWLTNAIKIGDRPRDTRELSTERRVFRHVPFIGLGKRSQRALREARIPCWEVRHPAYYIRMGRPKEFIEEMGEVFLAMNAMFKKI